MTKPCNARQIERQLTAGHQPAAVAARFGVHPTTVSAISRGGLSPHRGQVWECEAGMTGYELALHLVEAVAARSHSFTVAGVQVNSVNRLYEALQSGAL